MRGWRVRVVALPKILVQHIVTPRNVVPLGQLPEAAAIHLPRGGQASRFEQRRPHVDVGHDFFDNRAASNHLRTMHQKRHPHWRLVCGPLVDQSLFAKLKPVVAHVNNERWFEQVAIRKQVKNTAEIFVHREQCFAVTDVVGVEVEVRQVVGKVHTVPTVPLIPEPARFVAKVFAELGEGLRQRQFPVLVTPLVPIRRHKVRMHRLMRKRQEKRAIPLASSQPIKRVVG